MFGHIDEQYTLPIGVMAEIDADAGMYWIILAANACTGTITLLEAGVV